jgi:hypothetical protein
MLEPMASFTVSTLHVFSRLNTSTAECASIHFLLLVISFLSFFFFFFFVSIDSCIFRFFLKIIISASLTFQGEGQSLPVAPQLHATDPQQRVPVQAAAARACQVIASTALL